MTIRLYAQPYDISATGFYFSTADDYAAKAKANRNDYDGEVEERGGPGFSTSLPPR